MTVKKEDIIKMQVDELNQFLEIVGELGYIGYKISMCKLYGNSYQQCANRFKVDKSKAQRYYEKCIENGYDIALKKLFGIK